MTQRVYIVHTRKGNSTGQVTVSAPDSMSAQQAVMDHDPECIVTGIQGVATVPEPPNNLPDVESGDDEDGDDDE